MAGVDGSERSQGASLSPICNGDVQDERTKLVGEYVTYRVGWQPACGDFVQGLPAPSDWILGQPRQANTWSVSNSYHWALLDPSLLTNAKCIMAAYGSVPPLNSGNRAPSDQIRAAHDHKVKNWNNALHVRGLAVDVDTPNGAAGQQAWDSLKALPKQGACGVGCIEDRSMSPYHFHVDYRPIAQCPAG